MGKVFPRNRCGPDYRGKINATIIKLEGGSYRQKQQNSETLK